MENRIASFGMMRNDGMPPVAMFALLVVLGLAALPFYLQFLKGLKVNRFVLWLIATVVGPWLALWRLRPLWQNGDQRFESWFERGHAPASVPLGCMLLVLSGLAMAVKLYCKWLHRELNEDEDAIGNRAFRAWFGPLNLICCLGIALGAWAGYDCSFWATLMVTLLALAVHPALRMLSQTAPAPLATMPPPPDLSSERERVLRLLESGKITAAESAQLLSALGEAVCPPSAPPPLPHTAGLTLNRKLLLAGGVVILIAFFLPWYSSNLGTEMQSMNTAMGQVFGGTFPEGMMPNLNAVTRHAAGGDMPSGLGWLVLLFGLGAAVLPFLNLGIPRSAQTKVSLVALGVGVVMLVYLLTDIARFAGVGLVLVFVGYGLVLAGTLKDVQGTLGLGVLQKSVRP